MNSPPRPSLGACALPAGARFGNYHILERLGAGGMGEVYRAKDLRLGREVAIKTILLRGGSEAEALARFEQEARAACALNHPNIVTIYELGQVEGTHYIAMELVYGDTVRRLLASGPIPFRNAVAIAAQIADALAKAHEMGVVHRDLKPENLMVSREGAAKILDFGLAKPVATERLSSANASTLTAVATEPGMVMGTVGYMSPEQANGETTGFRSDQFSFGAVLYEMVSGRAAFQGRSRAEIMAGILRDRPERLGALLQSPDPFFWILERCLAKDPKLRYSSTRELARELAALRDGLAEAPVQVAEERVAKLPAQRTAFIGREREITTLSELLGRKDARLITLTGPGGIGKTRLGLQVAGEMAKEFAGGVCFVPLAAAAEPSRISSAVAQGLGLRESAGQTIKDCVKDWLSALNRPMLLLLDNFEHLVAGAGVVAEMLAASAHLKIMVTSQAALHIYGEQEFPVPPLAVPDQKSAVSIERLAELPAVALFVERARAVRHDFAMTKENAPAIVAICARLDGLPLAIELAAARSKMLSPAAMLARLENSLSLLTGGARDLPLRQQTLRGTVEWSYNLLNQAEQTLLQRLSVFVGGCTLEAAEAVGDTKGDLGINIMDGMASMVDKSLMQQIEHRSESRFLMLSTIREYARERLGESHDAGQTRRAHAAYYLVLGEEGAKLVSEQAEWLERFEAEHDNFRAALGHLIETQDAGWGLRLGAALFHFWEMREYLTEARIAIAQLLKLRGAQEFPALRGRLLFDAAVLAGEQGDFVAARQLFEESLQIQVELHDEQGVAVTLNALAINARERGDFAAAAILFERCVAIWKGRASAANVARALSNLASVARSQGQFARAQALYEECAAMFQQEGDSAGVAWTLNYQGDLAREQAAPGARQFYEQSLNEFRRLSDAWGMASTLCDLANLERDNGNYTEAGRLYGESLTTFRDVGHKRGLARVLEALAASAAAQSNDKHSLCLAGAAAALRQNLGAPLTSGERSRLEHSLDGPRQRLGNAAGMAAWMEGWLLPLEQAMEEALSGNSKPQ